MGFMCTAHGHLRRVILELFERIGDRRQALIAEAKPFLGKGHEEELGEGLAKARLVSGVEVGCKVLDSFRAERRKVEHRLNGI